MRQSAVCSSKTICEPWLQAKGADEKYVRKEGSSKVQCTVLLAETRTGHEADAGVLEQLHAVECIRCHAGLGGFLLRLFRQLDLREQVHRACETTCQPSLYKSKAQMLTLRLGARDAFERLERLVKLVRSRLQAVVDAFNLALVLLVAGVALLRWLNHNVHTDLTLDRRAELGAGHLEHLALDLGLDVDELKVAAATTTFANLALAGRVEGDEFDVLRDLLGH